MIEFDVLRDREGRLVVAHDYEDALSRRALDLTRRSTPSTTPPLDKVEIDCDLKLPGREAELAGALAGHGLVDRAMVSTMEISSLQKLAPARARPAPRLDLPEDPARLDRRTAGCARPWSAGWPLMRRQFPKAIPERAAELGLDAVWAYHHVITPSGGRGGRTRPGSS